MTTTNDSTQAARAGDGKLPQPVAQIVSSGPANMPLLQWLSADHSFRAPIGSYLYAGPLMLETAEEARKDRAHAEAYYRQAERLLTANEATLHAEVQGLRAALTAAPAAAPADDARRMDWLAERLLGADWAYGEPATCVWLIETDAGISADLRASIDAAMGVFPSTATADGSKS